MDGEKRNILEEITVWYLAVLTALLPVKFGSLLGVPQAPVLIPEDAFTAALITWPTSWFPIASGCGMILAFAAFIRKVRLKEPPFIFLLCTMALGAVSLLGLIRASCREYGIIECTYLLGLSAYAGSIYLAFACSHQAGKRLLGGLLTGFVITVYLGLAQILWEFDQQAAYIAEQEAAGMEIRFDLKARMLDRRVFAGFALCNTLAGYLVAVFPLLLAVLWQFLRQKKASILFAVGGLAIACIAFFPVYVGTGSRAGFLTALIAMAIFVILFTRHKWLCFTVLAIAVLIIAVGGWYTITQGRGTASMEVRADYIARASEMMLANPLCGTGWGDFFHDYTKIKKIDSAEAPHTPHNFLLALGSQCGFPGFLIALAVMLYPLIIGAQYIWTARRKRRGFPLRIGAAWLGLTAFYLHAMLDAHLQVPGAMATAFFLGFYLLAETHFRRIRTMPGVVIWSVRLILLLFAAWAIYWGMILWRGDVSYAVLTEVCQSGQSNAVENALHQAIADKPWSPFPYLAAGDYYMARNRLVLAKDNFTEALTLSPERAATYQRLAQIAQRRGDMDTALKMIDRAIELFPKHKGYRELRTELEQEKITAVK